MPVIYNSLVVDDQAQDAERLQPLNYLHEERGPQLLQSCEAREHVCSGLDIGQGNLFNLRDFNFAVRGQHDERLRLLQALENCDILGVPLFSEGREHVRVIDFLCLLHD